MELATRPPIITGLSDGIIFQSVDWHAEDSENFDADLDEADRDLAQRYVITVFGVTSHGNSICVQIQGHLPTFYVELSDITDDSAVLKIMTEVKKKVRPSNLNSLAKVKIVKRKKMAGFDNYRKHKFIELSFYTRRGMMDYLKNMELPLQIPYLGTLSLKAWESNIDPMIRFFHERNISPAGWISLDKATKANDVNEVNKSMCQIFVSTTKDKLYPHDSQEIAPMITASFDIESGSSHGEFPVAKKTYRKLAQDLISYCGKKKKSGRESIHDLLISVFDDASRPAMINKIYTARSPTEKELSQAATSIEKEKLMEQLTTLKNAKAQKQKTSSVLDADEKLNDGIERLLSRLIAILGKFLPKVCGDKVIQIGTTLTRFGDPNFCVKHIACLHQTDPVESAHVISCKTEKEVLLEWTKFIQKVDPDIVTGKYEFEEICSSNM